MGDIRLRHGRDGHALEIEESLGRENEFYQSDAVRGKVTDLCKEFGISRKTAYKFVHRYSKHGPSGLHDVSRRPHHCPNQTPEEIKGLILKTKQDKPTWGAGKIREWLLRKNPEFGG